MQSLPTDRVIPPEQGALTLQEAGTWLRLSRDALRELVQRGEIRTAHIGPRGGRVVISVEELRRYLRERTEAGAAA